MKNRSKFSICGHRDRIITKFGHASLVRMAEGGIELRGGRQDDRTAAKEWISLFMHEAVPRFTN